MAADQAPLMFRAHLGMLRPANRAAEEALHEIKGPVRVTIKGGYANSRRRGLYWSVLALVVPLLNDAHGMTLDENDLHEITKLKLRLYDEVVLPSGDMYIKFHSTSDRAMNEAERAAFTTNALALWSAWTGVDVTALREEAARAAA